MSAPSPSNGAEEITFPYVVDESIRKILAQLALQVADLQDQKAKKDLAFEEEKAQIIMGFTNDKNTLQENYRNRKREMSRILVEKVWR